MIYDLAQLRMSTEEIIDDLQGVEDDLFPDDPINWGDLHCIEAARVCADDGREYYRVVISEASESCWQIKEYVRQKLNDRGFVDIEIQTEW